MPLRALLIIISLLLVTPLISQNGSGMQIRKIVIDPGHGGTDPGAISPDGRVKEKDITLSVSLKLGEMIKSLYPSIEVIYTRNRDVFVPLDRRSEIANKSKADLFISIHVNAARSRAATGSETFVMGVDKTSSNLEVTMLENSVILLEGDDYSSRYEGFNPNDPESYIVFSLLQNAHLEQSLAFASLVQKQFGFGPIKVNRGIKQAPLLVLWRTSMPSVLVELGFISNSGDLKVLTDKNNHDRFATLILNALTEYKRQFETAAPTRDIYLTGIPADTSTNDNTAKESKPPASTSHYRIQILAVGKILPSGAADLKGMKNAKYIKHNNLYKYTVGEYPDTEAARRELEKIRTLFPQAFIIKVENGEIVPINR